MYPGKSRRLPVLIGALLLTIATEAQGYRVRYRETVRSDYGSMTTMGKGSSLRADSAVWEGAMELQRIDDSTIAIRLQTVSRRDGHPGTLPAPIVEGWLRTDTAGRIGAISAAPESWPVFLQALPWLSELHFRAPRRGGLQREEHPDGSYRVNYGLHHSGAGTELAKSDPSVVYTGTARQAMVFDSYEWTSRFDAVGSLISLEIAERKRQYIGRRALACIARGLWINRNTTTASFQGFKMDAGSQTVTPFRQLSDAERRRQISKNILGTSNLESLQAELAGAGSLGAEQRFRLKSRWRALLLLDTGSHASARRLYATAPPAQRDIIEDAMLESGLFSSDLALRLESLAGAYEELKRLLIKLSLAGAMDEKLAGAVLPLLQSKDPNTANTAALTLSNGVRTLRDGSPELYRKIVNALLAPFRQSPIDTLQYLCVAGNAGLEVEWPRLRALLNGSYRAEAFAALRNLHIPEAVSLLFEEALRNDTLPASFYSALLAGRQLQPAWASALSGKIIAADDRGDAARLPAFQFLLDEAYRSRIQLDALLRRHWRTEGYRAELASFTKAGALCTAADESFSKKQ